MGRAFSPSTQDPQIYGTPSALGSPYYSSTYGYTFAPEKAWRVSIPLFRGWQASFKDYLRAELQTLALKEIDDFVGQISNPDFLRPLLQEKPKETKNGNI